MTRMILMIVFVMLTHSANAETPGQRRARELAHATLAAVERIERSLRLAIEMQDEQLLRERVTLPLNQLQSRWRNAPGATDKDKFTHDGCINAVNKLTSLHDTYVFRVPLTKDPESRRSYLRELYREELDQCRDSIRNPAKH